MSTLNPFSPLKHRMEKRFVPKPMIKAIYERSGGRCECYIFDLPSGRKSDPYKLLEVAEADALKISPEAFASVQRCPNPVQNQPHHVLNRSQGGNNPHTLELLLHCCTPHAAWPANNVKESVRRGLTIPYRGFKL